MGGYVEEDVVAGDQYPLILVVKTDMALGVPRCPYSPKTVCADLDHEAVVDQGQLGNRLRFVLEAGVVLQDLHEFVGGKAVHLSVIGHELPATILVENPGVDPAEVDGAAPACQPRNQSRVVGVHVGYHKIGLGRVAIEGAQTLLHGLITGGAVESRIDDEVPSIALDDV